MSKHKRKAARTLVHAHWRWCCGWCPDHRLGRVWTNGILMLIDPPPEILDAEAERTCELGCTEVRVGIHTGRALAASLDMGFPEPRKYQQPIVTVGHRKQRHWIDRLQVTGTVAFVQQRVRRALAAFGYQIWVPMCLGSPFAEQLAVVRDGKACGVTMPVLR